MTAIMKEAEMGSSDETVEKQTDSFPMSIISEEFQEEAERKTNEKRNKGKTNVNRESKTTVDEVEAEDDESCFHTDENTSYHRVNNDNDEDDGDKADDNDDDDDDNGNPPRMMPQVLAAIVIGLTHLGIGTVYGFPGVTLPQLTQPDSEDIYLTPEKVALFGSVVNIGAICGAIPMGSIAARFGLKTTLLVLLPFTLVLWLLLAFSPNVELMIVVRFCCGAMVAAINVLSIAYVLEMAHKDRRGLLYATIPIIRQIGYCYVYSLGVSPLSWRKIAIVCGITTTTFPFIAMFFFPESPRWLVTKGREKEATKSLLFFRGKKYNCKSELVGIIADVKATNEKNRNSQLRQMCQHHILKVISMLSFLTFLVSISGSFALVTYMVPIFQSSSTNINPYHCAILVASSRAIGTVTYSAVIDKVGRRSMHIHTYVIMSITLAIFATYLCYQETAWSVANLNWLPLVIMILYAFFLGVGQPTLFMINGELLPNNIRSLGLAILTAILFIGAFLQTLLFPIMKAIIGGHGAFWFFSACSLSVSIFTYVFVPETSGKTLEEIAKRQAHRKN